SAGVCRKRQTVKAAKLVSSRDQRVQTNPGPRDRPGPAEQSAGGRRTREGASARAESGMASPFRSHLLDRGAPRIRPLLDEVRGGEPADAEELGRRAAGGAGPPDRGARSRVRPDLRSPARPLAVPRRGEARGSGLVEREDV